MIPLQHLKPIAKPNVIDLVKEAGLDVSDWANCKNGEAGASANPKYCYEWCFDQEGIVVFNIWFENMLFEKDTIVQRLNFRNRPADSEGNRKARALRFDLALQKAFENGIHPRVIILDRPTFGEGSATARSLDHSPWTVSKYDFATGDFELRRGAVKVDAIDNSDQETAQFLEGERRRGFRSHRHREAKLREQKIEASMAQNDGRLICEVQNCGFDFEAVYGELGRGFSHVHHLVPLALAGRDGIKNTIDDLAVVCANCHAMIHRGGECREMEVLIAGADDV